MGIFDLMLYKSVFYWDNYHINIEGGKTMDTLQKNMKLCRLIALALTAVVLLSLFLPYASTTKDAREQLNERPDVVIIDDINLTAGDMKDISLFEFTRIYRVTNSDELGAIYTVLFAILAVLALLAVVFALLKLPIGIIIVNIISLGVFFLTKFDFTDRKVIDAETYNWGFGHHLFLLCAIAAIAVAIWMIVVKSSIKKASRPVYQPVWNPPPYNG